MPVDPGDVGLRDRATLASRPWPLFDFGSRSMVVGYSSDDPDARATILAGPTASR